MYFSKCELHVVSNKIISLNPVHYFPKGFTTILILAGRLFKLLCGSLIHTHALIYIYTDIKFLIITLKRLSMLMYILL